MLNKKYIKKFLYLTQFINFWFSGIYLVYSALFTTCLTYPLDNLITLCVCVWYIQRTRLEFGAHLSCSICCMTRYRHSVLCLCGGAVILVPAYSAVKYVRHGLSTTFAFFYTKSTTRPYPWNPEGIGVFHKYSTIYRIGNATGACSRKTHTHRQKI